jgi:hypothetical protein
MQNFTLISNPLKKFFEGPGPWHKRLETQLHCLFIEPALHYFLEFRDSKNRDLSCREELSVTDREAVLLLQENFFKYFYCFFEPHCNGNFFSYVAHLMIFGSCWVQNQVFD